MWCESCSVMCNSLRPHGLYRPWNSPGQNIWVGSLSLLQRIFPTQGSNPGLPHFGQILYQLSSKGSSRILEWVAYPFSSGSSWPKSQTRVSCIAGGFLTSWAHLWFHWGLSPTPSRSLCQRVNLQLQFIKFLVILPFNFQLSLHLERGTHHAY